MEAGMACRVRALDCVVVALGLERLRHANALAGGRVPSTGSIERLEVQ